eukprot:TRINITY_DN17524_c0_g1_i1.p1 TRINITY_DN17524_c0_g1~~TRINITY_DN17524_c0_g1_i1.p1  ORF type:complete len:264 (+),score=35.21 TRINITY_DN17524_c0_g1_i1:41-793(+)
MSVQAEVKRWIRSHGFAEAETGEIVYVHVSSIPGMRLKVGETIFCDLIPVEGHSGRVKGDNVSGPGVVPATERPEREEMMKERDEWNRFKMEKIAVGGAPPPRRPPRIAGKGGKGSRHPPERSLPSARRDPYDDFPLRGQGALPLISARQSSSRSTESTRIDPADGCAYTKEEFRMCYKGYKEWDDAAPKPTSSRGRGSSSRPLSPEKRIDPADGCFYTKDNFFSCYGGYKEWDKAAPSSGSGRGRGARR